MLCQPELKSVGGQTVVSSGYVIMSLSSELETFQTNIDFWTAVTSFQLKYFRIYLAHCVQLQNILGLSLGKEGGRSSPIIELRCDPGHYKHSFQ